MSGDEQDGGYWPSHHPLRRIERKLDLLLERIPEPMSDALAAALVPLDAAVTQNSADILNIGSLVTTDFAALQAQIGTLQAEVAAGGTIPAADLTDIANQVSILAQAHTASMAIIANLGSIVPAGTVAAAPAQSTIT